MDVRKARMVGIAASGPILNQDELTRRANIVVTNILERAQLITEDSLQEGGTAGSHPETRQVLAEAWRYLQDHRDIIEESPYVRFTPTEITE